MSIYAASKHAVEVFSESLDHEVCAFGIRIVVIEPSFTRTQLGHTSPSTRKSLPDYRGDRERVLARGDATRARRRSGFGRARCAPRRHRERSA